MNENIDDKILRDYAAGDLSEEALQDFERRLQAEPELRAELDLYLALKAADNLRLKKQLAQVASEEQLRPAAPSRPLFRRLPVWLAAAASLALVLAALWWWLEPARPGAAQLAQTYIETPFPPPVAAMGGPDTASAAVQRAYLAYRTGDFVSAARQLTELANAPDAGDEVLFYAGESMLQTGEWERSLDFFNRVRPGYWRESADWRSALALLKAGRPDRARPLLEKLRNSPRRAQAEALLEGFR